MVEIEVVVLQVLLVVFWKSYQNWQSIVTHALSTNLNRP